MLQQEEIDQLLQQKQQLENEIDALEKKTRTIYEAQVNGKITLPCQTQMHINPEFHLVMDKRWIVRRVQIYAILSLDRANVFENRLRLNNEITLDGFGRVNLPETSHVVQLYDRVSNQNNMFFE